MQANRRNLYRDVMELAPIHLIAVAVEDISFALYWSHAAKAVLIATMSSMASC